MQAYRVWCVFCGTEAIRTRQPGSWMRAFGACSCGAPMGHRGTPEVYPPRPASPIALPRRSRASRVPSSGGTVSSWASALVRALVVAETAKTLWSGGAPDRCELCGRSVVLRFGSFADNLTHTRGGHSACRMCSRRIKDGAKHEREAAQESIHQCAVRMYSEARPVAQT
jgi:hypothetical protein